MEAPIRFLIVIVSDRCSKGQAVDKSGSNLAERIQKDNLGTIIDVKCIPDEQLIIKRELISGCDYADVILTVGGTGFSPRDVTPEATKAVIQKEVPGFPLAMTLASLSKTKFATLSRAACGIRGSCLIINLPGSAKGSMECFEAVSPTLVHAVKLLRNENVGAEHNEQNITITSKVQLVGAASRLRESPWPMLSVEAAHKTIADYLPSPSVQTISLSGAGVGYVVAEDIFSKDPLPPFRASIKDGYAVLSADGAGVRHVKKAVTAGMFPDMQDMKPGECVRVNTGGPIPPNASAVVQVEDTQLVECDSDGEELVIKILIAPIEGQDIRGIGSDIPVGELVLKKGDTISPIELGLLAATNTTNIPVYRLPRVGVLSTGNELIEPGTVSHPGAIRDSNRILLLSLLKQNYFPTLDLGIVIDEPTKLMQRLEFGVRNCEVLLTTGGVSMGEKDFLKAVLLQDFGANVHFGRVNMKPGKPTTFATCSLEDGSKKVFFCLPGNPVSAAVTFQLFVLPALRNLAGYPPSKRFPTIITVRLGFEIKKLDPRPEYRRVVLDWAQEDGIPLALNTGDQISSRLMSWREANALLILPSRSDHEGPIPVGMLLKAMLTARV